MLSDRRRQEQLASTLMPTLAPRGKAKGLMSDLVISDKK